VLTAVIQLVHSLGKPSDSAFIRKKIAASKDLILPQYIELTSETTVDLKDELAKIWEIHYKNVEIAKKYVCYLNELCPTMMKGVIEGSNGKDISPETCAKLYEIAYFSFEVEFPDQEKLDLSQCIDFASMVKGFINKITESRLRYINVLIEEGKKGYRDQENNLLDKTPEKKDELDPFATIRAKFKTKADELNGFKGYMEQQANTEKDQMMQKLSETKDELAAIEVLKTTINHFNDFKNSLAGNQAQHIIPTLKEFVVEIKAIKKQEAKKQLQIANQNSLQAVIEETVQSPVFNKLEVVEENKKVENKENTTEVSKKPCCTIL